MMINKRLIGTVPESKRYIAGNVICQWISLAANIAMMGAVAGMFQGLYEGDISARILPVTLTALGAVMILGATIASEVQFRKGSAV